MIKRLRVDPIACAAHGLCADLLPDHIDLDEWGYPILADGRTGRPLGRDDQRYLLNTIFLDDYCTWALRVPERQLQAAAELLLAAVSALRPDDAAFAAWRLPALLAAAAAGGGDGVEEEEEEEEEDEDDDDDGDDDEDDTDESSDDSSSSSSSEVAGGSAPAGWRPLIEVVEDTAATS